MSREVPWGERGGVNEECPERCPGERGGVSEECPERCSGERGVLVRSVQRGALGRERGC